MTKPDLATREGAEAFVEKVLEELHDGFKRFRTVPMMFHLLCTRGKDGFSLKNGEIGVQLIVVPSVGGRASKDDIAEEIRKRILDFRAIGVVFIAEAWALMGEDAVGHNRNDSIESHPKRQEIVHVSLEHIRTAGTWRAFITRDNDGKGTLGSFLREERAGKIQGRFTHLLHKERFA